MIFSLTISFRQMIGFAMAFLFFVAPITVLAQGVDPQPSGAIDGTQSDDDENSLPAPELTEIPVINVKNLAARPSLVPVFKAVAFSKMPEAHAEILVEYDMQGNVTDAEFLKSTRNGSVNKAILEWARRVKLMPGEAGKGRLLFDMETR